MGSIESEGERTIWCGNLSNKVTEEVLYELFLQAAPIEKVRIPTGKDGKYFNYGFITVKHIESVEYTKQLLNGVSLFGQRMIVKSRNGNNSKNKPQQQQQQLQQQQPYQQYQNMANVLQVVSTVVPGNVPPEPQNFYIQSYQQTNYNRDNRRYESKPYSRHQHNYNSRREERSNRSRNYQDRHRH